MTRSPRALTLAVIGLVGLPLAACAQQNSTSAETGDYPSKPIELVVGYDAGGPTDAGARLVATALEEKLNATITVVNKPGANSQIAYTYMTNAEPDGYTMAATTFPSAIMTVLDESRNASYDRDSFAPVALQVVDPTAVAVAPDSDIKTPEELVNAAKAEPGQLTATTTGVASNEHFALAKLQEETGAEIAPVHFADGASAATTAFLGGNTDLLMANVSDLKPLEESGKIRVVGVMDAERSSFLPDVPTFEEAGYDVEIASSRGFAFPAGTSEEIVDKVSTAIGEVMEDPDFEKQMTQLGLAASYMNAEDYSAYWDETEQLFSDLYPLVQENN
ncbi:Bug family tripartite tricarboxylate transporter substrate binding protein [Nocardioides insulae]|uniref:Bug family tripartite tricarboxylate transporter substrate binding protein n=1 Tax=Nocardioides insulae TaxID=394734 RepID=UPI0004142BC9|nr:tripartite tricarboxylate transporter substrate binding protein [Nocardioides insulae]